MVDDQEQNIQIVGATLGRLGFEIIPATSGGQALKRLALRQPDLILLDLLMPDIDGFEVCRKIKLNPAWAEIPIIFLSSADDKDLIVRALEIGGMDYITKPFNHAELTTRVRTHLALKTARDSLKQVAEDRDEMLGVLTHDLKNHLGGIHLSAGMLKARAAVIEDPKLRLMVENISASTGQMLAFVKEFLANASADHGLSIKPETLDLASAISRTLRQYEEAAQRKEISFVFEIPKQPLLVWADAPALTQVLDNLVSNALKFSPPQKQILISARSTVSHVECEVQDQGPGFKAEDRSRLFTRYGRLSARPTGGEPSTGLGLSIVKKLVHAMGGQLACEPAPGGGASLIFSLPRPTLALL